MALLSRGVGSLKPDAAWARPSAGQADSRSRSAVPSSDDGRRGPRGRPVPLRRRLEDGDELVAAGTVGVRRAPAGEVHGAGQRFGGSQRRGQRGHPEEAADVPEDPLVDRRGIDDRRRGQRTREVDVRSLQPLHGLVVPRDVVLHPRADVDVAPIAERLADRDRVGAAVQEIQECADLHAGHRHAPTDGRGGGRHRVTHGHQTRHALLVSVDVAQATADEHVGRRRGAVRVRPGRERGDGAARRFERVAITEPLQGDVGGRPDDDDREVPVLVREDHGLVAGERAAPGDGHRQGSQRRAVVQAVAAVDVGDATVATQLVVSRSGDPCGAPGRVDDQVGLAGRPVDHRADHATLPLDQSVHVAGAQRQPTDPPRRCSQRSFVRAPTGAHDGATGRAVGELEADRFGTEADPLVVGVRPLGQQEVAHLGAKAVRVLELHDTTTSPGAVSGRTRVAVDGDDLMTATGQRGAKGETGRAGADDEHSHDVSVRSPTPASSST